MATQVQFRRGTTAQHATFTGAAGEITVDTDKDTLVVHDGTTAGGFPLENADADILKADTTDNLVVGFTSDIETLGSNTITPDFQTENLKSRAVTGNVTINAPTTGNGACYIKLAADGSGPYTVTLGSGVTAIGTIPDLAASTTYIATVVRFGSSDAYCQIQEAG